MSTLSVIVCVRDGERWLAEALDSIMGQTRPPDEILLVDDGSSDGSMAIARRYPVRIVDGPRAGVAAAHTTGLRAASGELLGVLAQDDRYAPQALAALAAALEDDPGAAVAAGRAVLFTDERERFGGLREDRLDQPLPTRLPESVLLRAAAVRPLLPLRHGASWDVDLFLRIDETGARTVRVNELICHKRLRPDSTIHGSGDIHQQAMLTALRESIMRRRGDA